MKTHNPFLLLIAATAFCVSARGILGRSLSTELQSTLSASETRPAPVPRSECVCPKVRVCLSQGPSVSVPGCKCACPNVLTALRVQMLRAFPTFITRKLPT